MLYFDTETTGIPDRKLPWSHERQPRIVSIAWALDEPAPLGEEYEWHYLIKPNGWTIDESGKAFAAHHISQTKCEAEGRPIHDVLAQFAEAVKDANEICAYNIDFDIDMTRIECEHTGIPWLNFPSRLDILPLAQILCQIPPTEAMLAAGRRGFKPPKLAEALKILCKEDFPDAHDVLADVRATIKIRRHIEEFRTCARSDQGVKNARPL